MDPPSAGALGTVNGTTTPADSVGGVGETGTGFRAKMPPMRIIFLLLLLVVGAYMGGTSTYKYLIIMGQPRASLARTTGAEVVVMEQQKQMFKQVLKERTEALEALESLSQSKLTKIAEDNPLYSSSQVVIVDSARTVVGLKVITNAFFVYGAASRAGDGRSVTTDEVL